VYDEIGPFDLLCPGLAEVVKDGLTGLIDREGNLVVECRYDHIDAVGKYREGWLMVARDGLHGFVDAGGREVVPLSYDEVALPQPRE
jgi:hypothetical protein